MGVSTKISWANVSWNPWQGCHKVSAGCANCYMYRDKKRYGQDPTTVKRSSPATFNMPLKSKEIKPGDKIFVCSWSDFLIEEADPWRPEAWGIIRKTPDYIYLIVTKRIERVNKCLPSNWGNGYHNVWGGVTVENNNYIERVCKLLDSPFALRFLSVEPMLGPIKLTHIDAEFYNSKWCQINALTGKHTDMGRPCNDTPRIDWVICGGESGPNARYMNPDWARDLRDQCKQAGVPFFMKQMSGGKPIPEDLMIREFPI